LFLKNNKTENKRISILGHFGPVGAAYAASKMAHDHRPSSAPPFFYLFLCTAQQPI
jgi:hypothetical protein